MKAKIVLKGGPGSGNHGHAGRPGKVGGSSDGSGKGQQKTILTRDSARVVLEFVGSSNHKTFANYSGNVTGGRLHDVGKRKINALLGIGKALPPDIKAAAESIIWASNNNNGFDKDTFESFRKRVSDWYLHETDYD